MAVKKKSKSRRKKTAPRKKTPKPVRVSSMDTAVEHGITVDVKPIPKGRPRMTRYGRVFTPQTTLDAEAIIAAAWDGPVYQGLVEVECEFTPSGTNVTVRPVEGAQSKLRGDLDNYVKLLMDGLNGVAWLDDKQVTVIKAVKR
jgi:Holliday junction resolvase RusA-like endonuclease